MFNLTEKLNQLFAADPWQWPEEASQWILDGLVNSDPSIRRLACEAASETIDAESADVLLTLVRKDRDATVAAKAAAALGPAMEIYRDDVEFGDEFADSEDDLTQENCKDILRCLEAVYRQSDRPKQVRQRCLEAAVRGPGDWQPEAVRDCWNSSDSQWRATAVFCMGFLPNFDAQILSALHDENEKIRCEALRSAGRRGLKQAGDTLVEVAANSQADKDTRIAAVEALARVHPKNSDELLHDLMQVEDKDIAHTANYALQERDLFGVDGLDEHPDV